MDNDCNLAVSVRFATLRDVPTIANIYTSAMCEDEVFDYVCCYRDIYSEDHVFYYNQKLKIKLYEPHTAVMVAEIHQSGLETQEGVQKNIVAFAIWSLNRVSIHKRLAWREVILNKVMCKPQKPLRE